MTAFPTWRGWIRVTGAYDYHPDHDFFGNDIFTYEVTEDTAPNLVSNIATVTLTVTPVNDAPVAQTGSASGPENHPISGQAVATDVDNPQSALVFSLDTTVNANGGATSGTVTMNAKGVFVYTPNAPDFAGTDTFNYTVSDGTDTSNVATITINVNAVNQVPLIDLLTTAGVQTTGTTDTFTENGPPVVPVIVVPDVTLTDDDATLDHVTVTLTNAKTSDVLSGDRSWHHRR